MDAIDDACKLSEPAFRQQIISWMQSKEVNQRIQAKLRHDIIDCFSTTALGREVTMRHQKLSQYIVPPTSILALNTMVAEFLYTQNCQFTLSVFATEMPFPSALPDFESDQNAHPYRFRPDQLQDLIRSFVINQQIEEDVQSRYLNPSKDHINTSLLFSLLGTLCPSVPKERRIVASRSTQCRGFSRRHIKLRKSRKSLRQLQALLKQLVESIAFITESMDLLQLPQSLSIAKQKIAKLHRQIRRLSESKEPDLALETMSSLSNELNTFVERIQTKIDEDKTIAKSLLPEIPNTTMRYTDWVQAIRSSTHGKRFLQHLVEHYRREQQRELETHKMELVESLKAERTRLKQLYKERFLNRLQGLMVLDADTAKGRFLNESGKPEESAELEAIPVIPDSDRERPIKKQIDQPRLSSRKLPTIEIFPGGEAPDVPTKSLPKEIHQIAQQTRQRAQHLVEQSDDIESSIQKRLQKHTIDTQTIAAHQQHIRQRSHFDTKLISGVRCENTIKSPRLRAGLTEVQCASTALPVEGGQRES